MTCSVISLSEHHLSYLCIRVDRTQSVVIAKLLFGIQETVVAILITAAGNELPRLKKWGLIYSQLDPSLRDADLKRFLTTPSMREIRDRFISNVFKAVTTVSA